MAPFQYEQYRNPFVGSISDLITRPGDIRAAAAERIAAAQANAAQQIGAAQAGAAQASGQAYAGAAQGVGSAIAGSIQQATDPRRQAEALQLKEQKDAIASHDTFKGILKNTPQIQENGMNLYDLSSLGDRAVKAGIDPSPYLVEYGKVNDAFRAEASARLSTIQTAAQALAKAPDPDLAVNFLDMAARNRTIDQATAGRLKASIEAASTPAEKASIVQKIAVAYAGPQAPLKLAGAARPGAAPETAVNPLTHEVIATGATAGPAQPTGPSIAMEAAGGNPVEANRLLHPIPQTSNEWKDVLLDGKPAKVFVDPKTKIVTTLSGQTVDNPDSRIKPIPPASTIINPQAQSDVKEAVAAMKDGTAPPILPGRATKEYLATIAEAHKQGFDIQKAATDWTATQKHIATMNGAQQLRLNQSINALPDMLDKVDELASQWKGGRFPILNKANLALAKGGAYGKDAATIANQLDAQIADVTADLGNVYMGGNSPTDHALGLAGKSLSGDWDEKVLHDMVKLAKGNVTIRQNSIRNTGVAGASADNPYGSQPSAPAGETWIRDANGKLIKK